jgi:2-oxoglutarate dehydrogenase E2 component (dihydrolipoamide succinyltransferase)
MIIEIKVPSVGESVTEAILAQWFKQDGDVIHKGEPLFVIETDKITLEVEAEEDGVLSIKVAEGETLAIGAVVGTIDTENAPQKVEASTAPPVEKPAVQPKPEAAIPSVPATAEPIPAISVKISQSAPGEAVETLEPVVKEPTELPGEKILPPSVRRLIAEKGANVSQISGTGPGGRVTKGDVLLYLEGAAGVTEKQPVVAAARETVAPQTIESFENRTQSHESDPATHCSPPLGSQTKYGYAHHLQ